MLFGCCTTINNYGLLQKTGYGRIILAGTDVSRMTADQLDAAANTIDGGEVKCRALNSFCGPDLKLLGDGYDVFAVKKYIELLASKARKLGVKYIGIGSPKSRNVPLGLSKDKAMEQWKTSLKIISGVCGQFDIMTLVEPVCDIECNWMNTTDSVLSLIGSLNDENIGIVYDTYHAYAMKESALSLKPALPHIKLVHIAHMRDKKRHYLSDETIKQQGMYYSELLKCGYKGEISVEAFEGDEAAGIRLSLDILKRLCAANK